MPTAPGRARQNPQVRSSAKDEVSAIRVRPLLIRQLNGINLTAVRSLFQVGSCYAWERACSRSSQSRELNSRERARSHKLLLFSRRINIANASVFWHTQAHCCTIVHMDIVADTNIFLAAVLNKPEKTRIINITSGVSVLAPEILPY